MYNVKKVVFKVEYKWQMSVFLLIAALSFHQHDICCQNRTIEKSPKVSPGCRATRRGLCDSMWTWFQLPKRADFRELDGLQLLDVGQRWYERRCKRLLLPLSSATFHTRLKCKHRSGRIVMIAIPTEGLKWRGPQPSVDEALSFRAFSGGVLSWHGSSGTAAGSDRPGEDPLPGLIKMTLFIFLQTHLLAVS